MCARIDEGPPRIPVRVRSERAENIKIWLSKTIAITEIRMTDATDGKNNLAEERKAIKKNPPKVIMCARLEERTQSRLDLV